MRLQVPGTWKHRGPGEVIAIPSLRDSPCMKNCSERGAICVALDPEANVKRCVCSESGIVLDFRNPHCNQGEYSTVQYFSSPTNFNLNGVWQVAISVHILVSFPNGPNTIYTRPTRSLPSGP